MGFWSQGNRGEPCGINFSAISIYAVASSIAGPWEKRSGLARNAESANLSDPTSSRWQKIKDLFGRALELDPSQREAFLDQSCDGDLSLRREVESLIAASTNPTVNSPSTDGGHDRMIGRRLGAYQILKLIEPGGMSYVYLGFRADEEFRRQVAVKVIQPSLERENLIRRFRHERQTLAALDHPNIVKLLDGGTTEEGLPYLVMDYVDGLPIDDYCHQHRLTIEQRLRLFRTVCAAVEYAHKKQVVHRDLKPNNVLVTVDGVPKLLDFGIAKLLKPDIPEVGILTVTGPQHMTPAYASPEQVRGERITCASDIYSLGVLLYRLLTSHRPYSFKNNTPAEVERVICEAEPERPSTVVTRMPDDHGGADSSAQLVTPESISQARGTQPDKLRRRLRGDLDNIVLKALHKKPKRRYSSAHELAEDIERHLQDRPVKARPPTLPYRAKKFIRRRKREVVAASVVLMLATALVYSLWRPTPIEGDDSIAIVSSGATTAFTEGIAASIVQNLSRIPKLRVVAVRSKSGQKIDARSITREFGVKQVLIIQTIDNKDSVRLQIDLLDGARGSELWGDHYDLELAELLKAQDRISREVAQRLTTKLGKSIQLAKPPTENPEAYQLFLQGRYNCEKRTAQGLRNGAEAIQQAIRIDPGYALAYAEMSACLNIPNYYGVVDPRQILPKARAAALKALELDGTLAEAHEAVATSNLLDFDFALAEQEFKRSLELNPNYSLAHFHYAVLLSSLGRFREAVNEAREGQRREPMSAIMNAGVAFILSVAAEEDRGMLDECVRQSLTNLEIAPTVTLSYLTIGMCYEQKQMYREALQSFQKGIDMGGPYILLRAFEAHAYGHSGDKAKARRILAEIQDAARHNYVSRAHLAMVYDGLGEKDLEIEALQQAYGDRDPFMIFIGAGYFYDVLHTDSRFQELERKIGVRQ